MKVFALVLLCACSIWALPIEEPLPNNSVAKAVPLKDIGSRITNGSPASSGQFPWQVALYLSVSGGTVFCGGSLISQNWVLTAAHCAQGVTGVTGYFGVISLTVTTGRETRTASRAIVHASYSSSTLANDVALLQLNSALTLSNTIRTISLATSALSSGVDVTVSGWGVTSDNSGTISNTLNYVSLSSIANSQCSSYYGSLHEGIVCVLGGSGQSTCSGDSGGPLITGSGTNAVQVGVVSFVSAQGCTRNYPSGYGRVAYYRSWISTNAGV